MKNTMSTIEISRNQIQELESFIAFINEMVESLKGSKRAVTDFVSNIKFCIELRKQRKTFTKQMKVTKDLFPKLTEKKQADLEIFYYKGLNELNRILPSAERDIRNDFLFPINIILIRELKITIDLIANLQSFMSEFLYPDNSQKLLNDPALMTKMNNLWADCDDY